MNQNLFNEVMDSFQEEDPAGGDGFTDDYYEGIHKKYQEKQGILDRGIAYAKSAKDALVETGEKISEATEGLGDDLWDRSWAGAAMRKVSPPLGKLLYPWMKEDQITTVERQDNWNKWKEKYDLSFEEYKNYTRDGVIPPTIIEADRLQKERETTAIAEEFGPGTIGKIKAVGSFIKDNPKEFLVELGKGIAADPELLGLPSIYKATFASLAKSVPKAGSLAAEKVAAGTISGTAKTGDAVAHGAGIAAEGAVGAGLGFGGEALLSAEESPTGEVDWDRAQTGGLLVGGAGMFVASTQSIFNAIGRAGRIVENKASIKSEQVQATIYQYAQHNKVSLEVATSKVLERYGVDPTDLAKDIRLISTKLADELGDPAAVARTAEAPAQNARGMAIGISRTAEADAIKSRLQPQVERVAQSEAVAAGTSTLSDGGAGLARDIRRIAWKEKSAAFPAATAARSPAEELFTSSAFKPAQGTITKPILTLQEFSDTAMGKGKNGQKLSGAALQSKYQKFHKDMIESNRDRTQVVTMKELEDIMLENNAQLKTLFMESARKKGTRASQIPKKYRPGQEGRADQDLMALMSAGGFATLIAYGIHHNMEDAVMWGIGTTGSLVVGGKLMKAMLRKNPVTNELISGKTTVKLDELYNKFQGDGAVYERKIRQIYETMKAVSGEKGIHNFKARANARKVREQVTYALEDKTGKAFKKLSPEGQELYKITKKIFSDAKAKGLAEGILDDTIDNYVPHIWERRANQSVEDQLQELFGSATRAESLNTIHRNTRVIPSYALGKQLGMTPRTLDIADITAMYLKSMDQAARGKALMNSLKKTRSPLENLPVIMSAKKAPKTYKDVGHPLFAGKKVHQDIAEPVRAIFGNQDFSAMMRGLLGINFLFKRQAVSLSGFHAKALLFSQLMAGGLYQAIRHPLRSPKDIINMFSGKSPALKALYSTADTETSRAIDELLENGLVINIVDDVGKDTFYEMLADVSNVFNRGYDKTVAALGGGAVGAVTASPIKGISKAVKGYANLNKLVDTIMWDRIYTHGKLVTALRKMEGLAAKHGHELSRSEMAQMAAEFTNDAFGGLNWVRLAQNVENKTGANIAYQLTGRKGRAVMQNVMFAPDWTTSQIRIFYKAFANKNPIQREMYLRYQYTGLLMFGLMMDAMNVAFSGKHFWENDDPATVDLGDGRRISLSKQYFEPAKWVWKPEQSAMNKLSTFIRTGAELGLGQQYTRHDGMAPPIENTPLYLSKKLLPIWGSSWVEYGTEAGLAGAAGFPIYGKKSSSGGRSRAGGLRSLGSRGSSGRGSGGR